MIQFLRGKNVSRKIFMFLTVIIGLSFFVSGAIYYISDSNAPTFLGKIGSRKVSVQEYLQSYRAVLHQAALIYGDQLEKVRPFINFRGEAWDRLLLLDHAKSERISIRDQEVVEWIRRQPVFQSAAKQFDDRYYETVVTQYLRTTLRDFEEEIRQMLVIAKLREKTIGSIKLDEKRLRELYAQEMSGKDIQFGLLPWESQVQGIEVTEEELQSLFPLLKDRLGEPEKMKIRYVLVPAGSPNEAAVLQESSGALSDIASRYGLELKEPPVFSQRQSVEEIGLPAPMLYAAVALTQPGQTSDWVREPEGSYKVEMIERTPAQPATFEQVKGQLKDLAVRQKAVEAAMKRFDEIRKSLKNSDFRESLEAQGVTVSDVAGYKADTPLPGIGISAAVARALSDVQDGQISQIFQLPQGSGVVKLLRTAAVDEEAFSKDKEAFREKALTQQTERAMDDLLIRLRNRLELNLEAIRKVFPETEQPATPAS